MPVLYLDLDGTVRFGLDELGRFVNGPDDVTVFPGVPELLASFKDAGWRIAGVSNQGGIALGHVSREAVEEAMMRTQELCGFAFDKIVFCPHHPDADDPEMAVCWCRKPKAGLLIETANVLAIQSMVRLGLWAGTTERYPPHMALMVGDRDEDRGAAAAANVRFMEAHVWRALSGPPE